MVSARLSFHSPCFFPSTTGHALSIVRNSTMRLANKTALISGGGTGIGKAIAICFAAEGARVMIVGRRKSPLAETVSEIHSHGGQAAYVIADYAQVKQVKESIAATISTFGTLDILVNNAGVAGFKPILEVTEEDYEYQTSINLKGLLFATKFAIPLLASQGGGSIVNISSGAGLKAVPLSSVYGTTKAGVVHLTKISALETADKNIRVNCICPGFIETPIFDTFIPKDQLRASKASFSEMTPLKRMGRADEVAKAALYLVSEDASWMTGNVVTLDGGLNIA